MNNPLLEYFSGITPESKLCKDCKHCKISYANKVLLGWEGAICVSPRRPNHHNFIDVVTGEVIKSGKFDLCVTNRFTDCAKEAYFFEPRNNNLKP